jgi:hypothetical protein
VAVATAGVVLSLMATEFVVAAGVGVAAVAGEVVEGDVGGGAMPGDQDPGDGPVTGQPPTPLGRQRPGPADLAPQRSGAAEQALQVDRDGQLRPDPTDLREPPAFQGPAGQLGQGVGATLAAAAVIGGAGRAGQRLQGGQQDLAGLGFQ